MDSFTFNKIAGSVLSALLVIFGAGVFIDETYPTGKHGGHGEESKEIQIVEIKKEEPAVAAAPATGEPEKPIAVLLASAKVEDGVAVSKKCASCHVFNKGGKNGAGPHLYDVMNRPLGAVADFAYSNELKAKGGNWDYEAMNAWLKNPKGYISGTKMNFAGLAKPEDRAAIIAYLRSLSDNPAPLPAAAADATPPK